MGKLKIQIGKREGGKLTTIMKTDEHTTRDDVIRCVEWQAGLMKVSGGVALERFEPRNERTVMYMRGATAYITSVE